MSQIIRTVEALRDALAIPESIALVPTMGALHAGHISLVEQARDYADVVVVSIFVNPTQFGAGEDFNTYPKREKEDRAKLKDKADIVFIPDVTEMYPDGFATTVSVKGELTEVLCGVSRPTHFDGVATVVTKLLLQVLPDVALFGEKDYQQLQLIRRLVTDLNIPTEIIGCAIVREEDGLAMSSRNQYLNAEERAVAPIIYDTLCKAKKAVEQGSAVEDVLAKARDTLTNAGFRVDYLELRDAKTLALCPQEDARLFVAAFLGNCRLIDNIAISC